MGRCEIGLSYSDSVSSLSWSTHTDIYGLQALVSRADLGRAGVGRALISGAGTWGIALGAGRDIDGSCGKVLWE